MQKYIYHLEILLTTFVLLAGITIHPLLVLALICTLAVIFAVFEWPELGFWITILLTSIETIGPIPFNITKTAKLAFTGLVGIFLLAKAIPGSTTIYKSPYCWSLLLALIFGIPASLLARSQLMSFAGLCSVLIFVVFHSAVLRSDELTMRSSLLIKVLLVCAVVSSLLCFWQLTHGYTGFWGSAEQQSMASDQSYDTLWPFIFRASAAFNGPNAAGAFLALGTIAALVHAQLFRKRRFFYLIAALLCGGGLLTTFSRGAVLGCVGGCVFAFWAMGALSRIRLLILIFAVAAFVSAAVVNDEIRNVLRIGADIASASPTRVDAWHAARVIAQRNPVFGIGFYEFHDLSQGIIGSSDTPVHPHNGFLKALVEEGPAGAVGYLLFAVTFLTTSKKSVRRWASNPQGWVLASIAGIGTSLFIQELFDAGFVLGSSSIAILFASLLAVQVSLNSQLERGTTLLAYSST